VSLTLAEARSYADRAMDRAQASGRRIAVAVLNGLGELIQLDRMDGTAPMNVELAEAKARTALNFERPTGEVAGAFAGDPERLRMIESVVRFKPVLIAGGLPVLRQGVVVGAIGVSGADPEDDAIARAAIG
jgi:uncharacterized protein GlcG (DUF336 family)